MNIMNDVKLFVLAETLKEKSNDILKICDCDKKINVRQYEDHYSYEIYTDDLSCIISIDGKGLDEKKYYPELIEFLNKVILQDVK